MLNALLGADKDLVALKRSSATVKCRGWRRPNVIAIAVLVLWKEKWSKRAERPSLRRSSMDSIPMSIQTYLNYSECDPEATLTLGRLVTRITTAVDHIRVSVWPRKLALRRFLATSVVLR